MNGAAMDFHQDQALHQKVKSSGLHMPSTPLQNSLPHNSKAMNHPSEPYVDLELWKNRESNEEFGGDFRNRSPPDSIRDFMSRRRPRTPVREPMELPVPQFEIDENYVGEIPNTKPNSLVQNSKDLDLDTRINLLIKSKALSGMHPIFSELSESEDFSHSSDESLSEFPVKSKHELSSREFSPQGKVPSQDSFDNPETPLSRPPSPFLSRATYLFWFNKAIELKQQAKAQEKALIEEATKKLLKNNSAVKPTNQESAQHESNLLKILLDEVGKELKEAIKEHFLNQIIESAAFDSLESWWDDQKVLEDKCQDTLTAQESDEVPSSKEVSKCYATDVSESVVRDIPPRSTSPKEPFPWKIRNSESEETTNVTNQSSHEEKVLVNTIVQDPLSEDSELSKNSQKEDDDSKIVVSPVRKETVLIVCNKISAENEENLDKQQVKNITKIEDGEKEVVNEDMVLNNETSTFASSDTVILDSKCYNLEISVDEHKPIENLDSEVKCPDSIQRSLSLEDSCNGLIKTEEQVSSTSLPESEMETSELKDKSSQILSTIEESLQDSEKIISINSPIKN